jgi:hypothetical protein
MQILAFSVAHVRVNHTDITRMQDARLTNLNGSLLLTYYTSDNDGYNDTSFVATFGLSVVGGTVQGFIHLIASTGPNMRNVGLLLHKGHLQLVSWASQPMTVESAAMYTAAVRSNPEIVYVPPRVPDSALISGYHDMHLHLSGSPLHLPHLGQMLQLTHNHRHMYNPWISNSTPTYGFDYFHHFLLFDDRPPWTVRSMSAGWCLPTAEKSSMCEAIQFGMSMVLDADDTTTLLITYGVNNCTSRVARLPLLDVLALARAHSLQLQRVAGQHTQLWLDPAFRVHCGLTLDMRHAMPWRVHRPQSVHASWTDGGGGETRSSSTACNTS